MTFIIISKSLLFRLMLAASSFCLLSVSVSLVLSLLFIRGGRMLSYSPSFGAQKKWHVSLFAYKWYACALHMMQPAQTIVFPPPSPQMVLGRNLFSWIQTSQTWTNLCLRLGISHVKSTVCAPWTASTTYSYYFTTTEGFFLGNPAHETG